MVQSTHTRTHIGAFERMPTSRLSRAVAYTHGAPPPITKPLIHYPRTTNTHARTHPNERSYGRTASAHCAS